jgi:thiosulfate/3-mercaptopyruvate sulfurtransferase
MPKNLISTAWLAEHLGKPELVVFDATKYLPNEPRDAMAEFRAAHVPGARFFDIDANADLETDLPHMVPTPGRFARLIGALGVANDSFVVFYDQKGLASAARGWWMMGLFGHDQAAVLDGGLPKWVAEQRPVESGEAPALPPANFRPDFRAMRLRGIGDMLANLESGRELVLDARAAGRFTAQVPEPRPGMRSGHIPGSVNLPYTELLAPDQTMLAPPAMRARLARAGVDGRRPIVTSCGSGITACIVTLAMVQAGLPAGAVYDGSWSEWGGRADTPIET